LELTYSFVKDTQIMNSKTYIYVNITSKLKIIKEVDRKKILFVVLTFDAFTTS